MKEIRAIVAGLVVVVVIAMAWAFWQRPAKQFHRVGGYRIEVQKREGDSQKHLSFTVPMVTVARIASLIPVSNFRMNWDQDWSDGELTGKDLLEAASQSQPGKPGVIERNGKRIEVAADGTALEIQVKDEWDKRVTVRVPRTLVEGLRDQRRISLNDILKRLDEMGPGDVVHVQDGDNEVKITAEPK